MASCFGGYTDLLAVVGAASVCIVALQVGRLVYRVLRRTIGRSCVSLDVKQFGHWAVVTGSTDGIGKSYAFKLAEKGMDIVLISRNPEKLSAVATQIGEQYNVSVKVICADFRHTDIYPSIQQQLSALDIGILVNNVGIINRGSPCYFCEADDFEQSSRDLVNVNILSYVMMTTIILPGMLERKRGAIINISSFVGMRPFPFFTLYSATKAFIRFFSEALSMEYSSQGITIQVVTPNMVQTSMTDLLAKATSQKQGLFYPSPDHYTTAALSTLGQESTTSAYWPHELQQYVMGMVSDRSLRRLLLRRRNKMADMLKVQ